MTETLLVNEIFGPTIQGEGPATGRKCAFVRLAICPLRCRWCDTAYTWAFTPSLALRHQSHITYDGAEEVHKMSIEDIVKHTLHALKGSQLVILSGGEPLAQVPPSMQRPDAVTTDNADPVAMLIKELYIHGVLTHIETAGVRLPSPYLHQYVNRYVVSPKLVTSGNSLEARRKLDVLEFFAQTAKADFKFVITTPADFSEVALIENLCRIPQERIWVMPEGTTAEAIQRKLPMVAEGALKHGYNVSTRLHVHIWGDERKR
jgi:organic radical activating enzyme